jgi:ribosomal protein RSM22 (predicted rRNA methylase)
MSPRTFSLPQKIEGILGQLLAEESDGKIQLEDSKKIAESVKRLSDFYIARPEASTPWHETWTRIAYLVYYFPLNFLRAQAVLSEAQARQFPATTAKITEIIDFGSGLGSGSLPWMLAYPEKNYHFIEVAKPARELHEKILRLLSLGKHVRWSAQADFSTSLSAKTDYANHVASVFSYSLTELQTLPAWALHNGELILIEPSTRDDGRKLLSLREDLRAKNFSFWAPCPHQLACPLWTHSKTDWCHDRIHLKLPDWFLSIENHLPFKNRTLTFSYLLASRTGAPPASEKARLIGDPLEEKGKTRQLICRGDQREFLSWLHRDGEVPNWHRGDLIELPSGLLHKANELRLPKRG